MARINIEDSIFNDGRFKALEIKHGPIISIGIVVTAFKMAQTYWLKDRSLIPYSEFIFNPIFEDMLTVGLAEKRENGVYIRGSEEQFAWIAQRQKASKIGGLKNKEKIEKNRKLKLDLNEKTEKTSRKIAEREPNDSRNEAETKPDDSPLYSLLFTLNTNKNTTQSGDCDESDLKSKTKLENEVMQLFNAESQKNLMPPIKTLTTKRINWIKKAHKLIKTGDNWKKIFEIAGTKSFQKKDGTYFQADFDFIFEKERYVKYLEEIEGKITAIDRMSEKEVVAAMFGGYQID